MHQKPVRRLRFSPSVAALGNAGHRLVGQPVQQRDGTLVGRASPKSIPPVPALPIPDSWLPPLKSWDWPSRF
jgi:hypothetical protein